MKKTAEFFREHKHIYAVLIFIPLYASYFFISKLREPVWQVHSAVDDAVPFVPAFIIFYFLWYLYISLPLIWLAVKSRTDFLRMVFFLAVGMVACHVVFIFFPSEITFRTAAEQEIAGKSGLIPLMCRFIYSTDLPRNVYPSMHCFESVAIHIALCHSETGRKYRWMYPISLFVAVMICLSTMFIKQHSFYDVLGGICLAFLIAAFVYIPKWKFLREKPQAQGVEESV